MWGADRLVSNVWQLLPTLELFLPKTISLNAMSFVKQMTLETGEIGRQANGAVNLTYGDTVGRLCALSIKMVHSKSERQSSLHSHHDE